jgi:hypothetical protein
MSELVRKVQAACSFGTPSAAVTREITGEVQDLVNQNLHMERLLLRVRSMCEADGVSPTVAAIRKVIDDGSFS